MGVLGWRLDLMILEVFSNLNDSMILWHRVGWWVDVGGTGKGGGEATLEVCWWETRLCCPCFLQNGFLARPGMEILRSPDFCSCSVICCACFATSGHVQSCTHLTVQLAIVLWNNTKNILGHIEANSKTLMAFPLRLVSPWGFLLILIGPKAFEITAGNINLPVTGITGFMFKGLSFPVKRSEKGRFQVMTNWPREALLGRKHRIFGCCSLLLPVRMTTCLSV